MINDYRLSGYSTLKVLQKSEFGEVELVHHKELDCRRVIKTIYRLHPQYDLLTKEARTLQKLRNEAVPIVYDVCENALGLSFIEEAVEGETLTQHLKRKMYLSKSDILDYSVKLTEIIIYLHDPSRRVLHLDIKPDNLILTDKKMKLIDFGSAICHVEDGYESGVFGTKGFAAPEQEGNGNLNDETDIFALGRTFEYMMMYAPIVPSGYGEIVKNCLRTGRQRYSSAKELKKALLGLGVKTGELRKEIWLAVIGIPTDYHGSRFAFELAATLRNEKRKKVILLDCNPLENLGALEENEESDPKKLTFVKNGVTIANGVIPQEIKSWRGRGEEFIICDFGNASPGAAFLPFDFVVYVGNCMPWTTKCWMNALSEPPCGRKTYGVVTEGFLPTELTGTDRLFECRSEKELQKATRCISRLIIKEQKKLINGTTRHKSIRENVS